MLKEISNSLCMTHIELEISNPCNEHCIHCYRLCEGTKQGFLSENQVRNVLEQAKTLGAKSVTITGGEPLLNSEWQNIIETADELNFRISLFTNGSLIKKSDAEFLHSIKNLKEVQFSLYGLDEKIHDLITGIRGSCGKTKTAINLLKEQNIPLFLNCPVMKENISDVPNLMRWCDDNGIRNCANIFIFGDSDYTGKNLVHRLSMEELNDFFEETMKDNGRLSYIWGHSYDERDLSKIEFYGGATQSLCISGDGTIYPAIGWYEPLGNINRNKLAEVFLNNQLLKTIRKISVSDFKECVECDCADFCNFCFTPHITANHGELGKLDKERCKFIHFIKNKAHQRDEQLIR